jgi:hypothetical protein
MPRKPLRVVAPSERTPVKALTVAEAAASGDHRALLVAMRERIATAVASSNTSPRDLAALTRRLQDIAKEIEALDLRAKQEASHDGASPDEAWNSEAI